MSSKYEFKIDINPIETFQNMANQKIILKEKGSNDSKNNVLNIFLNNKSEHLEYLKKMIIKYKYSDKAYFLAGLYIDIIINKLN